MIKILWLCRGVGPDEMQKAVALVRPRLPWANLLDSHGGYGCSLHDQITLVENLIRSRRTTSKLESVCQSANPYLLELFDWSEIIGVRRTNKLHPEPQVELMPLNKWQGSKREGLEYYKSIGLNPGEVVASMSPTWEEWEDDVSDS